MGKRIEAFFAQYPALTQQARSLVLRTEPSRVVPLERIRAPEELDGSRGMFRAPAGACSLTASNDYEAIGAWLELQESPATKRAYRKEAERLLLWAIVERAKPISSLTVEDATTYRSFLRHPSPRHRWVGPSRPRDSGEWKPFVGDLSARSVGYAVSVLGALFRWLVEQGYSTINPFAGVKVRGAARMGPLDKSRAFSDGEWERVREVADNLESSHGWSKAAAARMRFLLDFGCATGLRASEFASSNLGSIDVDGMGDHWLKVEGKGKRAGKVALPPLARHSVDRYLLERGLPVTRARWRPETSILGRVDDDDVGAISANRLWVVVKAFFKLAATTVRDEKPSLADKLERSSPHWMRHTHASLALAGGAELTTVRDNLRHASISTTSAYLHVADEARAHQIGAIFPIGNRAQK